MSHEAVMEPNTWFHHFQSLKASGFHDCHQLDMKYSPHVWRYEGNFRMDETQAAFHKLSTSFPDSTQLLPGSKPTRTDQYDDDNDEDHDT